MKYSAPTLVLISLALLGPALAPAEMPAMESPRPTPLSLAPSPEFARSVAAEALRPVAEVIDTYVREGLRSNLQMRSQSLDVERSLAALDAARARFFPEFALAATYTRAEGGRAIDLPIGDLFNPAYGALNQLLAAQGLPPAFGRVGNQTIPFLLPRNQDTRISVRQPLYAPAIPAAVRAERALLESNEFARLALGRRLKRDVSVGYLDWLQATKSLGIVESSRALLRENLRVNESLYRNGKVTQDQLLRARAELLAVEQQLRDAANTRDQAQSYLNFLLNRELTAEIEGAQIDAEMTRTVADLAELRARALENRPEIRQSESGVRASASQVDVARSALRPTLSLGVDGGIQGERYEFGSGRNFGTLSLQLEWKFFDGGGDSARLHEARAAARQAATQRDQVAQQIQLEVQQALDRLETTSDSLATAAARAEAARAAFRIASRKRDEGVINQVEFMDARNTLTGAELNLNVTRFELLSRQAELDYATATGKLPAEFASR